MPSTPPSPSSQPDEPARTVSTGNDQVQATFAEDNSTAEAPTSRKRKVAVGVAVAAVAAGTAVVASRRKSGQQAKPLHQDTSLEVVPTGNQAVDEIMTASQRLLSGGPGLR